MADKFSDVALHILEKIDQFIDLLKGVKITVGELAEHKVMMEKVFKKEILKYKKEEKQILEAMLSANERASKRKL